MHHYTDCDNFHYYVFSIIAFLQFHVDSYIMFMYIYKVIQFFHSIRYILGVIPLENGSQKRTNVYDKSKMETYFYQ